MTTATTATLVCVACAATRAAKLTANGLLRVSPPWKRDGAEADSPVYCGDCWRDRANLRAVTLPVAGVLDCDGEPATWAQFREALREQWALATSLSNWALTQLYARDVKREPGVAKMPAMPRVYLYPEAREQFGGLPATTVAGMLQAVERKYRAARYDVIWTCAAALPTYRYPAPMTAPNQSWSVALLDDGRPCVAVRLGSHRWRLALRRGARYARQIAAVRKIADGSAKRGELAIYRKRAGESGGGDGGSVVEREGGQRVRFDVMCKLVAWLPRDRPARQPRPKVGTLKVRTAPDALLVAVDDEAQRVWTWHAAHIPRWVAEHRKRLDQWSDDSKAEQRPVPDFAALRDRCCEKQRHRLDSAVKEAVRTLANFARRRNVVRVELDDSDRTFCGSFPWFALRERMKIVLDEYRIEFACGAVAADTSVGDDASVPTVAE